MKDVHAARELHAFMWLQRFWKIDGDVPARKQKKARENTVVAPFQVAGAQISRVEAAWLNGRNGRGSFSRGSSDPVTQTIAGFTAG